MKDKFSLDLQTKNYPVYDYNTTASLLWSFCSSVENRLLCNPHKRILSLSITGILTSILILTNLKFVYWERHFTTLRRTVATYHENFAVV